MALYCKSCKFLFLHLLFLHIVVIGMDGKILFPLRDWGLIDLFNELRVLSILDMVFFSLFIRTACRDIIH